MNGNMSYFSRNVAWQLKVPEESGILYPLNPEDVRSVNLEYQSVPLLPVLMVDILFGLQRRAEPGYRIG
jgi:hypothetical protein